MRLRKIEFDNVQNASGARGFFGETGSFNWPLDENPPNWKGSTFVSKTGTLHPHKGNLKVGEDGITASEEKPSCILVSQEHSLALNSVGLTGPGIHALLASGKWQSISSPFFISVMAVSDSKDSRLGEASEIAGILAKHHEEFRSPFGLQINFSCPNTDIDLGDLLDEVEESLAAYSELSVPLVPKLNLLVPAKALLKIAALPLCDALYLSNTLPWGSLPDTISWEKLFDSHLSPLAHLGGGGLSGTPLFPILLEMSRKLISLGLSKPLIAGGGISSASDAMELIESGVSAISLGSVSMYAPQEVEQIISFSKYEDGVTNPRYAA